MATKKEVTCMTSGLSLQNSSLLDCASEHSRNAHDRGPLLRTVLLSLHCLTTSVSAALRTRNILRNKARRFSLGCLDFISSNSIPHDSLRVKLRGHPFLLCVSSVFSVCSWFQVPLWLSVITQVELMRSGDSKVMELMSAHSR